MRPKGGWSSSGTQNMQSSTGQYSTQAGEPAHPVQHSVITASSFGFFLRGVTIPLDRGSNFCSSGTIPTALAAPGGAGIERDYSLLPPRWRGFSFIILRALNPDANTFERTAFSPKGLR